MKPIKPNEVAEAKVNSIPDEVFEAFNELITENFSNGRAVVQQEDVAKRIRVKMGRKADGMFDKGWLDVEGVYEKAGWRVTYDKPGYNEDYEANFTFAKKR